MKNAQKIELEDIEKTKKEYLGSAKDTVLRHALAKGDLVSALQSYDHAENVDFVFSTEVKTMSVTDQKKSGRCWIFSASNLLREMVAKKAGIKDMFEISQNYISFYDKLEKINYTLEAIIDLIDQNPSERKLDFILTNGVGDGGQWDMYVNIVKKYGIVPKASMIETAQSSCTKDSNTIINSSLRIFAAEAQKLYIKDGKQLTGVRKLKNSYMKKFYGLLTDCFGIPPVSFDFEYNDSADKYHIEKGYTPLSFFEKYVGAAIDEYVSVINAPTKDKPYYQTYSIEYLGNVVGGKEVTHLNLPMGELKELIKTQLKNGEIVWFGSDVGKFRMNDEGIWDDNSFDYQTSFGLPIETHKADMLDYHDSSMNHAMVITGFDEKDDKPLRWKIENSWGDTHGKKGFFLMSDSFFDNFVYQAAINKKYLNAKQKAALEKKPVLLAPWDPFGTLAD